MKLLNVLTLLAAFVATGHLRAATQPRPAPAQPVQARRLTVNGRGEIHAKPDKADITLGVETDDKTAGAAAAANAERATKITGAILELGVSDADIQTATYTIFPITAPAQPGQPQNAVIIGYRVSNEVHITLRDIKKVGPAIDAATAAGANSVHSVSFGLSNASALHDAALDAAVKDARRKADILSHAAGVSITGVLELNDNSGTGPIPVFSARSMAMGDATPISPGTVSVVSNVTIVFEMGGSRKESVSQRPTSHVELPGKVR